MRQAVEPEMDSVSGSRIPSTKARDRTDEYMADMVGKATMSAIDRLIGTEYYGYVLSQNYSRICTEMRCVKAAKADFSDRGSCLDIHTFF